MSPLLGKSGKKGASDDEVRAAVHAGNLEQLKSLINKGADLNATNTLTGDPILLTAIDLGYKQIVQLLIDSGADVNRKNKKYGVTALHTAAVTGNPELITLLLAAGANPNIKSSNGRTPIHSLAVADLIGLVLADGADPTDDQQFHEVYTARMEAIRQTLKLLLGAGLNIDATDNNGESPLLIAIGINKSIGLAQILLEAGANVNTKEKSGLTPLHVATLDKNKEKVVLLLSYGADPTMQESRKLSPLLIAEAQGDAEILHLLKNPPFLQAQVAAPTTQPQAQIQFPPRKNPSLREEHEKQMQQMSQNLGGRAMTFLYFDISEFLSKRPPDNQFYTALDGRATILINIAPSSIPKHHVLRQIIEAKRPFKLHTAAFLKGPYPILRCNLTIPDDPQNPLVLESPLNILDGNVQEFCQALSAEEYIRIVIRHPQSANMYECTLHAPGLSKVLEAELNQIVKSLKPGTAPEEFRQSVRTMEATFPSSTAGVSPAKTVQLYVVDKKDAPKEPPRPAPIVQEPRAATPPKENMQKEPQPIAPEEPGSVEPKPSASRPVSSSSAPTASSVESEAKPKAPAPTTQDDGSNEASRFTQRARQVLNLAMAEAEQMNHLYIGNIHLLLGLLCEKGGVGGKVLARLGLQEEQLRPLVTQLPIAKRSSVSSPTQLAPEVQDLLKQAVREANQMGNTYIGTEHLLLALIHLPQGTVSRVLEQFKISPDDIQREITQVLQNRGVPSPVTAPNAQSAEDFNVQGMAEYAAGRYEQAIALFNRAIELAPTYALAYSNRGTAYQMIGNFTQALADITRAIEIDGTNANAYDGRGMVYFDQKNYVKAIQDFARAIELNPNSYAGYLNRANALINSGQSPLAVQDLSRVIELKPDEAGAYNLRGIAYWNQGDFAKADFDFTRAVELRPDGFMIWLNRGSLYQAQGNYVKALQDINRAIQLRPDYLDAYNTRGVLLFIQGNFLQAAQDFTYVLEHDPGFSMAYLNRGNAYYRLGNYVRALPDLNRAIELLPQNSTAYFLRGSVYVAQSNSGPALHDLTRAIELGYSDSAVYNVRGVAYTNLGQHVEALQDFDRVIAQAPGIATYYQNRGQVKHALGNWGEALADLRKYVQLAGSNANPTILSLIAQIERDIEQQSGEQD